MGNVVIVGAGVAGLGTALALSELGLEVTVLERDAGTLPPTPDEFFENGRRGAPQVRHSHAFLARLRNLLHDRVPFVLDALVQAGAQEMRFLDNPPPGMVLEPDPADDELVAISCRRSTFEWVLRSVVSHHHGVEIRDGVTVDGLAVEAGRAVGLRTDAGLVGAAQIIDASGPRSPLRHWLDGTGLAPPPEEEVSCDLVYASRFYRLEPGNELPPQDRLVGGDIGYLKYAVFPGDNGTFSITFGLPPDDAELRTLLKEEPFETACRALPATAPYRAAGFATPITGVHAHGGLRNRWRQMVVDGRPAVPGLIAVGDASACTNPLYGRGCSLAFVHAFALADAVAAGHVVGSDELALAFGEATRRELRPWFDVSVAQDRQAQDARGSAGPSDEQPPDIIRDGLFPASRTDPVVLRAFLRMLNLLDPPTTMMQDADVAGRVLQAFQERDSRPPEPPLGPPRSELVALLHG